MQDTIKNNSIHRDFSGAKKVSVEIYTNEKIGLLNINRAFVNYEIVGAHLLKSDEWIYGIYYGPYYHGYIYEGNTLTLQQQFDCVRDFLPQDRNDLQKMEKQYDGRIIYHESTPDSFIIICDINKRHFGTINNQQ